MDIYACGPQPLNSVFEANYQEQTLFPKIVLEFLKFIKKGQKNKLLTVSYVNQLSEEKGSNYEDKKLILM